LQNNVETLGEFLIVLQSEYFEQLVAMNSFFESFKIPDDDEEFPTILKSKTILQKEYPGLTLNLI
jgi:hypothetical protein